MPIELKLKKNNPAAPTPAASTQSEIETYTYTPEERDSDMNILSCNDWLGEGTSATVYLAVCRETQAKVAIKIFDSLQSDFCKEVKREVTALQTMNHENVISILNFGASKKDSGESIFCVVMPYIEGWNLDQYWEYLEKNGSTDTTIGVRLLPEMKILWKKLSVLIQVCNGMHHAHNSKIIHRDLKPGNIRIAMNGHAYILDFGIAKVLENPDVTQSLTITPKGTPDHMSPEHWEDSRNVDGISDLWSLGVILYQSVTGKLPFSGKTREELKEAICKTEPEFSEIEERLKEILQKALQKNKKKRYQHAQEMADDLVMWLEEQFLEAVQERNGITSKPVSCFRKLISCFRKLIKERGKESDRGLVLCRYSRIPDRDQWEAAVEQYKKCAQFSVPVLAPAVGWYGGDDVIPQEVCLACAKPGGKSLKEFQLVASDWEALLDAITKAMNNAKAIGFAAPSLPSAKYIFVDQDKITILGIQWPYDAFGTVNAQTLSEFLRKHLTGGPETLREMLNLPYEAKHSIEDLRDYLKRASELAEMRDRLENGPVDKGIEAAQTLIQWKTSGSELLRGKANELWPMVERDAGSVPKVVEVRDTKPGEGEDGWLKYPCKNYNGEEETYWIRKQEPEVVEESAIPQAPGVSAPSIPSVSAPSIIVVENKVLPVKNKVLTYGLPEAIWAECSYKDDGIHEGIPILDMSKPTWLKLAKEEGKQGEYARQYQIGYAKASQEGLVPYKGLELEIVIVQGGANIPLILIPPGRFLMGSPEDEKGRYGAETQHLVVIAKPYYMGKTPITQEQWEAVVSAVPEEEWKKIFSKHQWPYNGMSPKPSCFSSSGVSAPVECVNWYQCAAFCEKLGCTLSTEAEWEFACRGGSTKRWCFGDDESRLSEYAWYEKNSERHTHPVATEGKKSNGFGLYDMHGNVWEWVNDWYDSYPSNSAPDPVGPKSSSIRVSRGGSWYNSASYCRSANRGYWGPGNRNCNLGFRVRALNSIGINLRK